MSQRRARVLVGLAAAAAAALVVGVAVLQARGRVGSGGDERRRRAAPPLELGLAVRSDDEANALREAERLARRGRPRGGQARFEELLAENPGSVEAAVGAAIAAWPDGDGGAAAGARRRASRRAASSGSTSASRSSRAARRTGLARQWREAERVEPGLACGAPRRGHPQPAVRSRPAAVRRAARGAARARGALAGGAACGARAPGRSRAGSRRSLPTASRCNVSADRSPRARLSRAPWTPTLTSLPAKVAAALGRFDKDDPSQAFSRLGPLADMPTRGGVVRYHLGCSRSRGSGRSRRRTAARAGPRSRSGRLLRPGSEAAPRPS